MCFNLSGNWSQFPERPLDPPEGEDTRRVWHSESCEVCGDYIREGDTVVMGDGCYYHLECLENMSTRELLTTLGLEIKEVED